MNDFILKKYGYHLSTNLESRINFHKKYSHKTIHEWLWEQYKFRNNVNILELGCGIGHFWQSKNAILPKNSNIYLIDISDAMLTKAEYLLKDIYPSNRIIVHNPNNLLSNYIHYKNNISLCLKKIFNINTQFNLNIQNIDRLYYSNHKFDYILAHSVIHYSENIPKALQNIKKTLKDDGTVFISTPSQNNMVEILNIIETVNPNITLSNRPVCSFTANKCYSHLKKVFKAVIPHTFNETLEVDKERDIIDYIASIAVVQASSKTKEFYLKCADKIKQNMVNGIFKVTKEYKMYECKK